jgi:protein-S-isoprenylcysteine O-methyltransferase Ste14
MPRAKPCESAASPGARFEAVAEWELEDNQPGLSWRLGSNTRRKTVAIGTSILLLAVGAILRFAVYYSVRGIAIGVVGIVLMLAGALGLVLSFAVLGPRTSRRRTVVRTGPADTITAPGSTVTTEDSYSVDEPVNR